MIEDRSPYCDCDDFKEAEKIINAALTLAVTHGMEGLHKPFFICPYCGGSVPSGNYANCTKDDEVKG